MINSLLYNNAKALAQEWFQRKISLRWFKSEILPGGNLHVQPFSETGFKIKLSVGKVSKSKTVPGNDFTSATIN